MAFRKLPCTSCGSLRDARSRTGLCKDCYAKSKQPVDPRVEKALELARDGAEELVIASELNMTVEEIRENKIGAAVQLGHSYFISDARKRAKDRASKSTTAANDRLLLEEAGRLEMAKREAKNQAPRGSNLELKVVLAEDQDIDIAEQLARLQSENAELRRQVEGLEARGAVPDGALDLDWPPSIDDAYADADEAEQRDLHDAWQNAMSAWADRQVTRIREAGRALPPAPEVDDFEDPKEHARIMRMHRHLAEAWNRSTVPVVSNPFPSPPATAGLMGPKWEQKRAEILGSHEEAIKRWADRELALRGGKHPRKPLPGSDRQEFVEHSALVAAWYRKHGEEEPVYAGATRLW